MDILSGMISNLLFNIICIVCRYNNLTIIGYYTIDTAKCFMMILKKRLYVRALIKYLPKNSLESNGNKPKVVNNITSVKSIDMSDVKAPAILSPRETMMTVAGSIPS